METMTSVLLQDRWALTSKQMIGDQGPYRCNVFTVHQWSSQVACGQPRGQSTHTDIHIQHLESSFKVFYTSYTNWRKSPTAVLYCHWNWGEIFFNLNQRQERSTRAICFSKCHCHMHSCLGGCHTHESLSPMTKAVQGLWDGDYLL